MLILRHLGIPQVQNQGAGRQSGPHIVPLMLVVCRLCYGSLSQATGIVCAASCTVSQPLSDVQPRAHTQDLRGDTEQLLAAAHERSSRPTCISGASENGNSVRHRPNFNETKVAGKGRVCTGLLLARVWAPACCGALGGKMGSLS